MDADMLSDAIAGFLPILRGEADGLMIDTVQITRPARPETSSAGVVTASGSPVYGPAVAPHFGRALWKPPRTAATESEAGGSVRTITPGEVHLPVATTPSGYTPQPGDVIECITCQQDPASVGRKVTVQARFGGTNITQYRIPIEGP